MNIYYRIVSCLIFNILCISTWAIDVTIDGISYTLDMSDRTAKVSGSSLANIVVPETIQNSGVTYTVTAIGVRAFYYSNSIKTIKTGNTIKTIESDAFQNASSLQKVDFGNSLTKIGMSAFASCSSLSYIVIPSCINEIGSAAFYDDEQLLVICLREGFPMTTTYATESQIVYPSSFLSFEKNVFDYCGYMPQVYYTYNGIGFDFQITSIVAEPWIISAGKHTNKLSCSFANNDMSFDVKIPYTYTINPITLTAKVNDATRLYGDPDPQFTSTYTGFVNDEDASVILSHGSYEPTASIKSGVGVYAIKQSGAQAQNYVFNYEDGILTVNKAPLTMTANDKSMTYGSNVPTLDAKYEGLKNNEAEPSWNTMPEFSTTGNETSKVGTYPISISNADAKNYELSIREGVLTIEKAELTVKADDKSRLYGDLDPEFTLSFTGLKNNEEVPEWEKAPSIETTANVQSSVGQYPISIKDAVAVNYNINTTDGTLTINKAPLQVTPNNATRKYGEENPQFTLSYNGLKNNENVPEWTEEPVVSTQATKASSVGEYSIQVTSAEALNYTLEKKVGTLTITKAPLTVGVNNYSKVYGEPNPNFEMYYTGLLNDETAPEWTEMPIITTEATETSDVGEYAITATGGVMKNYETSEIASGILSVKQAALTIRANDVSRLYFEENPELTYTCTGFIGDDNEQSFDVKPQIKTSATKESNVGVYVIEVGNAESKNYSLTYEKGQLTINKRQLNVSTKDYTRLYGEENPEFELFYTGFVNNETEATLISKPKASTEADSGTDVGIYDITISGGVAENYDFAYTGGKLTIEQAYQTLSWEQDLSELKQYDQIELTAQASSGLPVTYTVEGDPICSIVKIGSKQYLDCSGEGETVIVAIQEGDKNYYQSTKIYKTVKITSSSGIMMTNISEDSDIKIFDVNGNQINKIQRGINIIKMSDGTTKKIVVK